MLHGCIFNVGLICWANPVKYPRESEIYFVILGLTSRGCIWARASVQYICKYNRDLRRFVLEMPRESPPGSLKEVPRVYFWGNAEQRDHYKVTPPLSFGPPSPPANYAGSRGGKRPPSSSPWDPGGCTSSGFPPHSQRVAALRQAAVKGDAVAQEDVDLVQLDALLLKVLLGLG